MIASVADTKECAGFDRRTNVILQAVEVRLRKILNTGASDIECRFSNGVLGLSGPVVNWHQKQLVQEAVVEIVGTGRVTNDIHVQRPEPV